MEMRGISKEFAGVRALSDVSIDVSSGEVLAICGENGAGKSTLMKILSGVYPHGSFDGEILWDGERLELSDIRDSERHGIVIIHQELALSPHMSVAENIFLGNEVRGHFGLIDWPATHRRASELLARVGLSESPSTRVSDLGVGKQQLVEIAKAFSKEVRLLILDEPTSALNDDESQHLLELVLALKEEGIASVIVSHKLSEIERVADRVTVIRDGMVIETLKTSDITEDRIIQGMVGRDMEHRYPPRRPHDYGDEALRVENWTVYSEDNASRAIIENASFHVRAGEIVGLCGLMGAGRTELAMSIFGRSFGSRVTGTTYVKGSRVTIKDVSDAIRQGIAYVTEDRKSLGLHLDEDIRRNSSLAGLSALVRGGLIDERREAQVAKGFRDSMNIKSPSVFVPVGELSGGNQQKVVLSKWIFTDPDILILDEPTRGIDVGAKYEIYGIIHDLAAAGKAVVFISSELPELLGVCDRLVAMSEGRITGELSNDEASPQELMRLMTLERNA